MSDITQKPAIRYRWEGKQFVIQQETMNGFEETWRGDPTRDNLKAVIEFSIGGPIPPQPPLTEGRKTVTDPEDYEQVAYVAGWNAAMDYFHVTAPGAGQMEWQVKESSTEK